ncbi:MAG: oligoendopeptidase F [Oscillospiraceae bacterium]|nr:oligoendopeptidase F [Oscillospiraceae bacterium]
MAEIMNRKDLPREDTWAVEDLFPDNESWEKEFSALSSMVSEFEAFRGKIGESAKNLYDCLSLEADLLCRFDRLYCYAHLNADADTADQFFLSMVGRAMSLYVSACSAIAFIPVEISAIPEDTLKAYMSAPEANRIFDRSIELTLRNKPHMRSAEVEELLAKASEATSAPSEVFKMLNNADAKFDEITDEDGNKVPMTHGRYGTYLESKCRRVRQEAFSSMYKFFGDHINTLAANMYGNVKTGLFNAEARGYGSAREMFLHSSNIPEEVYDNLIETVHRYNHFMYRYVALRKKCLGLDELHMYDLYTPIVELPEKKYSFEEAKELCLEAVKPMGEEYVEAFKKGLSERWIDFRENKGKRSGAYCSGAYSPHPYVLMTYRETLDNVFTLIHEMGHAMHSYFSNKTQPYPTSGYKIFVAEVASTCNEALLNKYLLSRSEDKAEKAFILNSYLDSVKGTLFRQTMFAEFERFMHSSHQKGEVLGAEMLCSFYKNLNKEYFGDGIVIDDEISREWARIPHFYTPFYVYQYATGFSAAVCLSEKILKGGENVEKYMNFLKGGGSKDPIDLLLGAGVDMRTPEPIVSAMETFESALSQLEELLA